MTTIQRPQTEPLMVNISAINEPRGALRDYLSLSDGERACFTCAACLTQIGVRRTDLPRFWKSDEESMNVDGALEGGSLLCTDCAPLSAPGAYSLADVFYPVDPDGEVLTFDAWDRRLREWVTQEWQDLDVKWRQLRRLAHEILPDSAVDWALHEHGVKISKPLPPPQQENPLVPLMAFTALDRRRAELEPVYDWAVSRTGSLSCPESVGWPRADGSLGQGFAPGLRGVFRGFLSHRELESEWNQTVRGWRRFMRTP